MSIYTFYLKNGLTFDVKAKGLSVQNSQFSGEITSFHFDEVDNFFTVNLSEVVAIVKK